MTAPVNFNTPARIIATALENAGMLEDGREPTSEQFAKYLPRLNDLVNLWQTRGIKLWLNRMMALTLFAGVGQYTLSNREMRVMEGYYFDSNQLSRPLIPLSWNTWNTLPDHNTQGAVNSYMHEKGTAGSIIHLWQVPDSNAATGFCNFLVQDPIANVISLNETMIFPNEWYIALHWGLADEICTGQPEPIVQRCRQRAMMYLDALEGWDVEDASTQFQPDYQGRSSKFR